MSGIIDCERCASRIYVCVFIVDEWYNRSRCACRIYLRVFILDEWHNRLILLTDFPC